MAAVGDEAAQKQFLGEFLFQKVAVRHPDKAGKVVGMILEAMQIPQICGLLHDDNQFEPIVASAFNTITEYENTQKAAAEERGD